MWRLSFDQTYPAAFQPSVVSARSRPVFRSLRYRSSAPCSRVRRNTTDLPLGDTIGSLSPSVAGDGAVRSRIVALVRSTERRRHGASGVDRSENTRVSASSQLTRV